MILFSSSLRKVLQREWNRIGERKTIYLLSIILPILLFLFLAFIYKNGVLRDIPVAVYDADRSELSRLIVQSIESTSAFRIVCYTQSVDEIKKEFQRGTILGACYIPHDLERDMKRGKPATLVVFSDETNLVLANTTLKDASTLAKTISGGILLKKLRSSGRSLEQAMNIINPIRIETQSLYNPTYNYEYYLVTGLLPVMLQMIIMVVAVLIMSSEFTHGTFAELFATAGGNIYALFLGKSLPHIAIHTSTILGMIGIIFPLFGIQVVGSVLGKLFLLFYFVLVSFFLGLMISTLFHNQQFATEVALFLNIPAFIFSGYIFPLWAMPQFHQAFALVLPYTHFLYGFLKLCRMGTPLSDALPEVGILTIFLLVSISITLVALHRQAARLTPARKGQVVP